MTDRDDEVARLRASEERLRLALCVGQVGVWEWYPRTGETTWDEQCLRSWGYAPGTRPSLARFYDVIHPEDRERVRGILGAALDPANGGDYEAVFRVVVRGEVRWILARGRCHFDASRQPSRFNGTLIDVTDRETLREDTRARTRRSEVGGRLLRRLAESTTREESLRAVCEETAAALDVGLVSVRAIDETTGVTSSAYIHGAPATFRARPAIPAEREAFLAAHGDIAQFPDITLCPDLPGRDQFLDAGIRSMAHVRMVSHGKTVGLLIAASIGAERRFDAGDMVFLKSAADTASVALASARVSERYERIVTGMSEGVAIADAHQRIVFANPAAHRFFGCPDLIGRPIEDFWYEEDRDARRGALEAAAAAGVPQRATLRYRTPDGREVWGSVAFLRFEGTGTGEGVLVIITDVTESRKLEAKMQQAQKLESLGVLAGGIAHDFNNLLVGILGNAGLALDEMGPRARGTESIRDIQTAAMRAADLTRQLLAYAGKGRFVITRIDVRAVVEEMGHLVSALIPKNVVLRHEFGVDVPPIEGDATQLRQVVMNLIANAADAIGQERGVITVATRSVRYDAPRPSTSGADSPLPPGDYVVLEVSDTGTGMSAETRARIFDPFFTTKFTGRGLGLAAVLGIVRAHRGSIDVESELGRGTMFRVSLPAAPGLADAIHDSVPPAIGAGSSGCVLVVDDDPTVRRVMQRTLERAGYRVLLATDGIEGVETFAAGPSAIDAVVLDVTMPRMGGAEAFVEMRKIAPDARILIASGFTESEATSRFAGEKLAGFLAKPFTPATLLERVREVLAASPDG